MQSISLNEYSKSMLLKTKAGTCSVLVDIQVSLCSLQATNLVPSLHSWTDRQTWVIFSSDMSNAGWRGGRLGMSNESASVFPQLNGYELRSKQPRIHAHKLYSYSSLHVADCLPLSPRLPVTGYGGLKLQSINPCPVHRSQFYLLLKLISLHEDPPVHPQH